MSSFLLDIPLSLFSYCVIFSQYSTPTFTPITFLDSLNLVASDDDQVRFAGFCFAGEC